MSNRDAPKFLFELQIPAACWPSRQTISWLRGCWGLQNSPLYQSEPRWTSGCGKHLQEWLHGCINYLGVSTCIHTHTNTPIKSLEVCSKGPYSLLKWRRALGVTGVEVSTSISRPFKPSLQTSAATSWLISLTWSNSNTCRRMQFRAVVGWRWGNGSKIMFKCPDSVIVSFIITKFLFLSRKSRGVV